MGRRIRGIGLRIGNMALASRYMPAARPMRASSGTVTSTARASSSIPLEMSTRAITREGRWTDTASSPILPELLSKGLSKTVS